MAIAFDQAATSIVTAYSANGSPTTWAHTCNGSDRLLVVTASIQQDAGAGTIASMTYGGVSMTKVTQADNSDMRSEVWYLIAPTTGSNTVSVTITGATNSVKMSSISYTGAAQSSVVDVSNTATGSSGSPTVSVTSTVDDALVVATIARFTTTAAASNRTPAFNDVTVDILGASSYQIATTAGAYSDTYTGAVAADWTMMIVSFKPLTTASNVIALDAVSSTTGAAVSSLTWAHTCAGTNRKLRVLVQVFDDTSQAQRTVTSVTYNAVACTLLYRRDQGNVAAEIWELSAPSTGTNNIVVTLGSTNDFSIGGAASFTGCDQTLSTNVGSITASGTTATTTTLGTNANNSWVITCLVKYSTAEAPTLGSGSTQIYNTSRGNASPSTFGIYGAGAYEGPITPALNPVTTPITSWTWPTNSRDYVIIFAELEPAGTATLEQEGYRWRYDNGTETSASYIAAQDTNITRDKLTNTRLRVLINSTGDTASKTYRLEYRVAGSADAWVVVN